MRIAFERCVDVRGEGESVMLHELDDDMLGDAVPSYRYKVEQRDMYAQKKVVLLCMQSP